MESNSSETGFVLENWVDGLTELGEKDINTTIGDILNNEVGALVSAFEEIDVNKFIDSNGNLSSLELKKFSRGIQSHLHVLEEVSDTISRSHALRGNAYLNSLIIDELLRC